ncbi:MAG: acyl carrier protein [Holosporales bacterium]|jgi:acyl carrier protein|nr:acyl carrier protein [Holosporales bacterium]
MDQDISARVKQIITEKLGVDADKVTETAKFEDDLGADSLDTADIAMKFEEEFSLEIPDDALVKIRTVGDAIKFIKENSKG